jgi:outer membrane cobalamin receptor
MKTLFRAIPLLLALSATPLAAQTAPLPTPDAKAADANNSDARIDSHLCLTETGSRIPQNKAHCMAANGQVYDRKDIDSTGATSMGDALRNLSPSLTITQH